MKQALILLLLTLAVSLGAIVNIFDEYIGSEPMGTFRKTHESHSDSGVGDTETRIKYFYDDVIPDRVIRYEKSYQFPYDYDYSKVFFEYQEFEDNRKVIESHYYGPWNQSGPSTDGFELKYVNTSTYDLQDKLIEYLEVYVPDNLSERTDYEYDDNGNLILVSRYRDNSPTPHIICTYGYDAQNRLTYYRYRRDGQNRTERWQTWSNHSMPDSIYTWTYYPNRVTIQKNFFDENGQRYFHQQWEERSDYWFRTDTTYEYTFAHQICFPTSTTIQYGNVISPNDDDFEPYPSEVKTYTYSNDYHRVDVAGGFYSAYCIYDENWILRQSHSQETGSDSWSSNSSYTWEHYTSDDDPTAVPPALVSTYPNPAKAVVNIAMSKRDAPAPAEVKVYNLKGQLVRSLAVSDTRNDQYLYNWDCKDFGNHDVPAGIYLIRIKTKSGEISKKVTVIK